MKKIIVITLLLIMNVYSQEKPNEIKYNPELAKKLGADEIGMRKYVMAFLKRGSVKIADSTERANIFKGHMDNINRMAEIGKLVIAGPFMDDSNIRGIYIFNVETIDEAEELTKSDPAIKAGTLAMELHPWYGSAALMQVPEIHKQIRKK